MSITEIKARVDQLGNAWENFKDVNNRRLDEIESKGSSDPLTENHLSKIGQKMDEYKSQVNKMQAAFNRPEFDGDSFSGNGFASKGLNYGAGAKEHKKAFCEYLRKGSETALNNLETKALSVGSDSDGGYLVSPQMSNNMVKTIFENSPMRKIANIETISSESLEIIEDNDEAAAGWTTETGVVSDTATPTIGKATITAHELYAQPKATQKLIDDSAVDIESWLGEKISQIFSKTENSSFINGDGSGKPRGILSYTAGTSWGQIEQITSGADGAISADNIMELYYSLDENYATNASFLMNRATVEEVRKLKDSNGHYLWNLGLAAGQADTLMGAPVYQAADMPIPATGSLSIALGDFKAGYQIVDRTGIRILRDPFTEKPFVKFYATKRVGGAVVNFDAIKLLQLSA